MKAGCTMSDPAAVRATGLSASERESIYRRNFVLFLADFALFSIGFNLIGPTTVIPDFVRRLTDSEILIAFSSQMFEVGWLLPQLLIARSLVRVHNKKWWFVGPNVPVRFLMLIFGGLVFALGADHPALLLGLFMLFYGLAALGDGVVGVPWLDLAASSLDNRRRARMFGYGNALVGISILGLTPVIRFILSDDGPAYPNNYGLLFVLAGLMFLITIPLMIFIRELPGGKVQEVTPPLREYLPDLGRVLRYDRPFRAMITARVLATLFTLAGPFYIGLGTERLGMESDVAVSQLLLMQTIGTVGGALSFSWWGDRPPLHFIRLVLLAGVAQPALALLAVLVGPAPLYAAFLVAGVLVATLGISFINWVLIYATPEQRPIYSGLFNSVSAVGLLSAPLLGGLIVEALGYEAAFIAALAMMLGALAVSLRFIDHAAAAAKSAPGGND